MGYFLARETYTLGSLFVQCYFDYAIQRQGKEVKIHYRKYSKSNYECTMYAISNSMLPESPYWLVFMGREKSAEKFFREAANMNKTKLPVGFKLKREVVEDDGVSQFDESKRRHHRSPRHCYSHEDVPSNVIDNLHSNNNSMAVSCLMLGAADSGTESRHTIHPHVGHFKELFQVLSNKMLRKEAGIASFTW